MKKLTREKLYELLNHQFSLNWYDVDIKDCEGDHDWFMKYPTTKTKEEEFKEYLRKELKPYVFKQRIEKEISNLILQYWLTLTKPK